MKNTRRFISAVMALSMLSAIAPMSALAADADRITIDQNSTEKKGTMTATYDVQAKYTVTIPAGVTLDSTNAVSKNIEASDVVLESGQKIKVTLTGASNTAEGSSFSAKNDKGDSTATYTIGKGEATSGISVGDAVAEFTEDGTQALTFSKAEGATYAGTHTETLTFGIAVEKPAAPSLADAFKNGSVTKVVVTGSNGSGSTLAYGFTNDNGSFTPIAPDGNNGYKNNWAYATLTKDNDNLVLKTMGCVDGTIGSATFEQYVRTYTFNVADNTYTYTPPVNEYSQSPGYRQFVSISVNGTEIPVTLGS